MNWQAQASASHYLTALAVQRELESGNVGEATVGIHELVEALSRSERRALKSFLVQLMAHVIKWQAQPERRLRGWAATIANGRAEIRDIQEETPSLSDEVVRNLWDESFARATRQAEGEMNGPSPIKSLTWDDVFTTEYKI